MGARETYPEAWILYGTVEYPSDTEFAEARIFLSDGIEPFLDISFQCPTSGPLFEEYHPGRGIVFQFGYLLFQSGYFLLCLAIARERTSGEYERA